MANELMKPTSTTNPNVYSCYQSAFNCVAVVTVVGGLIAAIKLGMDNIKFKKNGYEIEMSKSKKETRSARNESSIKCL